MSASTILGDVASAVSTALSTVSGLKVYTYEPRDLDTLPCVTIDGPTSFQRTEPEEAESQLGSTDWHLEYTLRLYVQLDDPVVAWPQARQYLGQIIAAIDADRTLGMSGVVLDATVANGESGYSESDDAHGRQYVIYQCALMVWALV